VFSAYINSNPYNASNNATMNGYLSRQWRHPGVIDVNSDQARQRSKKRFQKEERAKTLGWR
jgi:hypothetical protein